MRDSHGLHLRRLCAVLRHHGLYCARAHTHDAVLRHRAQDARPPKGEDPRRTQRLQGGRRCKVKEQEWPQRSWGWQKWGR